MMQTQSKWPPLFTVIHTPRGKNIRLKISASKGLEIFVPTGTKPKQIHDIVYEKKSWITKHLPQAEQLKQQQQNQKKPTQFSLPAINEIWTIEYQPGISTPRLIPSRQETKVVIYGNVNASENCCISLIGTWIKIYSKDHLLPWLKTVSHRTQLPYSRATIRNQKGRWASCSSANSINLNFKLLFLNKELVEHVMIHELCHTKHLNHSTHFWNLVAHFDPHWQQHRNQLRDAQQLLPVWVEVI